MNDPARLEKRPNSYFKVRDNTMFELMRDGLSSQACQLLDLYLAHAIYSPVTASNYGEIKPKERISPLRIWRLTHLSSSAVKRARKELKDAGLIKVLGRCRVSVLPAIDAYLMPYEDE